MTKRMISATLALIGFFIALYLSLYKLNVIGSLTCSVGSCEKVNNTSWAYFAGQPVALWGAAFYLAMFVLAFVATLPANAERRGFSVALTALSGWGLAFSLYLTGIELFVIHAICVWCVTSAVIVTLLFLTCAMDLKQAGAPGAEGQEPGAADA
jgi:uncharacterized membrane protein